MSGVNRTLLNAVCGFVLGMVLAKAGGWATVLGLVCFLVICLDPSKDQE